MSNNNFSVRYDSGTKILEIGNVEVQELGRILQLIDQLGKEEVECCGGGEQLQEQEMKPEMKPKKANTRDEKRKRNELICEEYGRGATATELAKNYGLATNYIYAIVGKSKGRQRSAKIKREEKPALTLGVGSRVVVVSNQHKGCLGLKGYVEQMPSEEGGYVFVKLDGDTGKRAFFPTGLKVLSV